MKSLFLSFFLFLLLLPAGGCGKRGTLIYPDMLLPAPPSKFSAIQSGNSVKISFFIPGHDRAGRKMKEIAGVRVVRLESPEGASQVCGNCGGFTLIRTVYPDIPDEAVQLYGSRAIFMDGNVTGEREYLYKGVAFTKEGVEGEYSPVFKVHAREPLPPPALVVSPTPAEFRLEFSYTSAFEGKLLGYNIYRREKRDDAMPLRPLNPSPFTGGAFLDRGMDRRFTYIYSVRGVMLLPSGEMMESLPSKEVEAVLQDED